MNAMAEFLPEAWRWVLEATLQACIIVAVIRVVQLGLGKRLAPRWHYALWLLLLARMVMPWAPESSVSIFNLIEVFRAPQVESMSLLVTEVTVLLGMPELVRPVVELPEPSLWEAAWALAKSVGAFPIIWFSGMGFVLAYVALRNFVLWRAFRRARPLTDEKALALLDACRSEMGIRRSVPVIVAGKMFSPALFGLVRPRLILPTGLTESISSEQLRFVFLHELSHLKRRDLPVNWLMTLVLAVHWMNPLLWYGYYRMRLDRELACDALALSYVQDEDPNEYGLAILELVERHCRSHRMPGMVGILENTSQLKRRISAIAVFKKNSYRWTLLAAAVLLTLGGAVLTDALATEEPDPEPTEEAVAEPLTAFSTSTLDAASQEPKDGADIKPPKLNYDDTRKVSYLRNNELPKSEDPLRRFVTLSFRGDSLLLAVEQMAKMAEIDIVFPKNISGSVNAQFTEMPLGKVIDSVLEVHGLRIQKINDIFNIVAMPADYTETESFRVRHVDPTSVLPHVQNLVGRTGTVSADLVGGHIIVSGTNRQVRDARNLIERLEAIAASEQEEDEARQQALSETVRQGNTEESAESVSNSELSEIRSTADGEVSSTSVTQVKPRKKLSSTEMALETVIGASFVDQLHLVMFAEYIGEAYDINIVIDSRVVRPPPGSPKITPEPGELTGQTEYVTDGMIPYVNLKNMMIKNILKAVLRPLNLDYSVQLDFVWISSPEKIRGETFEDLELGSGVAPGRVQEGGLEQQSDEEKSSELVTPSDTREDAPQEGDTSAPSDLVIHVDESLSPLENVLETVTNVTFVEQIHLIDFVEHIIEGHDINIMIDGRLVRPPEGTGDSKTRPDGTPYEYATDGIIPYVNFKNMRLKDILKAVLTPMNLAYSVQPGFVWITTPERLKSETYEVLETRYYEINQKVFNALFDEDAEIVTNIVHPDPENPDETVAFFQSDDFPFLPDIIDPVSGEILSYAVYSTVKQYLIAYNSPTNLNKFEGHLLETEEKILAEE